MFKVRNSNPAMYWKTCFFDFKHINLAIYKVKNSEIFSTLFYTGRVYDPTIRCEKKIVLLFAIEMVVFSGFLAEKGLGPLGVKATPWAHVMWKLHRKKQTAFVVIYSKPLYCKRMQFSI